ncbi:MAG: N-acetylmuramic acid 6-phosphate etherase [Actinomycetota bacterium]|nr:N-acetylmuramic acid 6-phosphate etherase [Actinomycetota bacterium]
MLVPTEGVNAATADLDLRSSREIIEVLLAEERSVPDAVAAQLDAIERAAELIVPRLGSGGRLHVFGAGTSGRLALLDVVELGPTFGVGEEMVLAHLAGASGGLLGADESAEDDVAAGALAAAALGSGDVALGVSASGTTPYVVGALEAAGARGAARVLLTCNPAAPLGALAEVVIAPETGPEVITGSTRLKAGTATKLVLNALSTTVMVRLGRAYSHYMVHVEAANEKLRQRCVAIMASAAGLPEAEAAARLAEAGGELPTALVMALAGVRADQARQALAAANGGVRRAIAALHGAAARPSA